MRTITVQRYLNDKQTEALIGTQLDETAFDVLVEGQDTTVYKPNGDVLCVLKSRALNPKKCMQAYPHLRRAVALTDNRGHAAGNFPEGQVTLHRAFDLRPIGTRIGSTRARPIKKDGTISKSNYAHTNVESGLMGYYDRHVRFPFCRQTVFTARQFESYQKTLPLLRDISNVFKASCPDRYAAQHEICQHTSPDFVIPGTVFTTVTVNRNWPTAVHQDKGDLKQGFGVMTAIRAGTFDGCYFTFPAYRVAINMQTTDVLLADVHEWHGNTPLKGVRSTYERISLVLYYRENMIHCLSAKEELERVKRRRLGDKLNA